jgi:potassium-transporting ATPase KdpC subunit
MKQDLIASFRAAVVSLLAFSVLCGLLYPLLVLVIGQGLFAHQANGSLLDDGRGSELIGQPFSHPGYFWSRRSALTPFEYNAMNSTGANYGPTNPALHADVVTRVKALHDADPTNPRPIPADLVTASSSGLDPHISPAAADYQADRVARLRHMTGAEVRLLIEQFTEGRTFGVLGEPRVNVLLLNRALDARTGPPR